jgi:hypothetical protein
LAKSRGQDCSTPYYSGGRSEENSSIWREEQWVPDYLDISESHLLLKIKAVPENTAALANPR